MFIKNIIQTNSIDSLLIELKKYANKVSNIIMIIKCILLIFTYK